MIGDALVSSQVLVLDAKSSGGGVRANYRFGSTNTPGGTFLITSVRGKDNTRNSEEDTAWQVQFLATPQNGARFNGVNSATVSIGTTFTDVIAVSESRGKVRQTERRDRNSARVLQLQMDESRGKGRLSTGNLPRTQTGIPEAGRATRSARVTFPLNITLTRSNVQAYSGEGSIDLVSQRTTWSNRTR